MSSPKINLRTLMNEHFDAAEFWWGLATVCRVGLVLLSFVTLPPDLAVLLPVLAFFTAGLIGLSQWRTETLKGLAGKIQRKFELYDGLGIRITPSEVSDMLVGVKPSFRTKLITAGDTPTDYFDSKENKSPRRLLENLEESSWWSKHLAHKMAIYVAFFNVIVIIIALVAFYVSVQSSVNQQAGRDITKLITSLISLLVSSGYVKLAWDYEIFSRNAGNAESSSIQMQHETSSPDAVQAIKLLHEYQIARASAPLLPSLLHRLNESGLNDTWATVRRKSVVNPQDSVDSTP